MHEKEEEQAYGTRMEGSVSSTLLHTILIKKVRTADMADQHQGSHGAAPAAPANPEKKKRVVKPKEGVEIKIRVPQAAYEKLKTVAEADYRTVDSLAFAATMKYVKTLEADGA